MQPLHCVQQIRTVNEPGAKRFENGNRPLRLRRVEFSNNSPQPGVDDALELLSDGFVPTRFTLAETRALRSGIIVNTYQK